MFYSVEDIAEYIAERLGDGMLAVCEVSASMPSAVKARYCHLRVYRANERSPKGAALRELAENVDYVSYEKVPHGGKSLRALYRRVYEAVDRHNESAI